MADYPFAEKAREIRTEISCMPEYFDNDTAFIEAALRAAFDTGKLEAEITAQIIRATKGNK